MGIRFLLIPILCSLLHNINYAQEKSTKVRLGVIADPQYADKDSKGSRFYRNSLLKLDTASEVLNNGKVDFTIVLGDLVDVGTKDLEPVQRRLARLHSPVYNMLGNHDFVDTEDGTQLYKELGMQAPYYVVEKGNWTFILLNTNELSEYATKLGSSEREAWKNMNDGLTSKKRKNAQPWNGGVGNKQLQWMEKQIKKAQKKSKDVIIFTHHPLFPENGLETLNNREILSIITKYTNIRAVISGHHHEGNFGTYKGIPMVTLEGMIETDKTNSYGTIDLYSKRIVLTGYGRMTSRVFEF